jgi:hypothetical protein
MREFDANSHIIVCSDAGLDAGNAVAPVTRRADGICTHGKLLQHGTAIRNAAAEKQACSGSWMSLEKITFIPRRPSGAIALPQSVKRAVLAAA